MFSYFYQITLPLTRDLQVSLCYIHSFLTRQCIVYLETGSLITSSNVKSRPNDLVARNYLFGSSIDYIWYDWSEIRLDGYISGDLVPFLGTFPTV